jgi:hypothetical protein
MSLHRGRQPADCAGDRRPHVKQVNRMRAFARRVWRAIPGAWRSSPIARFLSACYRLLCPAEVLQCPADTTLIAVPHLEISYYAQVQSDLRRMSAFHQSPAFRNTSNYRPKTIHVIVELKDRSQGFLHLGGGEPCLYRDLVDIVYITRQMWPDPYTDMELTPNGLLLHLHPDFRKLCWTPTPV